MVRKKNYESLKGRYLSMLGMFQGKRISSNKSLGGLRVRDRNEAYCLKDAIGIYCAKGGA